MRDLRWDRIAKLLVGAGLMVATVGIVLALFFNGQVGEFCGGPSKSDNLCSQSMQNRDWMLDLAVLFGILFFVGLALIVKESRFFTAPKGEKPKEDRPKKIPKHCPECGAKLDGPFCGSCGAKIV